MRGLSLVAASGGHSSSQCTGLSLSRPLLSRSTGSRRTGSVVVAHEPSCSAACGILPDQGSNPCPLHRQADSQPLRHQGSPGRWVFLALLRLGDKKPGNFFPDLWNTLCGSPDPPRKKSDHPEATMLWKLKSREEVLEGETLHGERKAKEQSNMWLRKPPCKWIL